MARTGAEEGDAKRRQAAQGAGSDAESADPEPPSTQESLGGARSVKALRRTSSTPEEDEVGGVEAGGSAQDALDATAAAAAAAFGERERLLSALVEAVNGDVGVSGAIAALAAFVSRALAQVAQKDAREQDGSVMLRPIHGVLNRSALLLMNRGAPREAHQAVLAFFQQALDACRVSLERRCTLAGETLSALLVYSLRTELFDAHQLDSVAAWAEQERPQFVVHAPGELVRIRENLLAEDKQLSLAYLKLLEHFGARGGLSCLLEAIGKQEHQGLPPIAVQQLLSVLAAVLDVLQPHRAVEVAQQAAAALDRYLCGLSSGNIKRLERGVLLDLLAQLQTVMHKARLPEAKQLLERLRLSVALKLLRCPFMQQRLAGLKEIRAVVESLERKQTLESCFRGKAAEVLAAAAAAAASSPSSPAEAGATRPAGDTAAAYPVTAQCDAGSAAAGSVTSSRLQGRKRARQDAAVLIAGATGSADENEDDDDDEDDDEDGAGGAEGDDTSSTAARRGAQAPEAGPGSRKRQRPQSEVFQQRNGATPGSKADTEDEDGERALMDVESDVEEGPLLMPDLLLGQGGAQVAAQVASAAAAAASSEAHELPWMTADFLCAWFREHGFVRMLFTPELLHTELLKRTTDIFRFLANERVLSEDDLALVWDTATGSGAHESVRDTVFVLIADTARFLSRDSIRYLWRKVRGIRLEAHDAKTLLFVRSFTVNGVSVAAYHGQGLPAPDETAAGEEAEEDPWLGLDLFWRLVQDECACSAQVHKQALQYLIDLCAWQPCLPARPRFLRACARNLLASVSVPQSLKLFRRIITSYPLDDVHEKAAPGATPPEPSLDDFVASGAGPLSRQVLAVWQSRLIEACLQDLRHYKRHAAGIVAATPNLRKMALNQGAVRSSTEGDGAAETPGGASNRPARADDDDRDEDEYECEYEEDEEDEDEDEDREGDVYEELTASMAAPGRAKAAKRGAQQEGNLIDSLKLVGKYAHLRGLRIRLNFLRFVMICGDTDPQLTAQQVDAILDSLGLRALTQAERSLALSWLMQMHYLAGGLSAQTACDALLRWFREFPLASIRARTFSFFNYFFRVVNADKGLVSYDTAAKPKPFALGYTIARHGASRFVRPAERKPAGGAGLGLGKPPPPHALHQPSSHQYAQRQQGESRDFAVLSPHLLGLGMLWSMALRAPNLAVARKASMMLCQLFGAVTPGVDAEQPLPEAGKDPAELDRIRGGWAGKEGLLVGGFMREAVAQLKAGLAEYERAGHARAVVRCLALLKQLRRVRQEGRGSHTHGAMVKSCNKAAGILIATEMISLRIKRINGTEFRMDVCKDISVPAFRRQVADKMDTEPDSLRFISDGKEILPSSSDSEQPGGLYENQCVHVVFRRTKGSPSKGSPTASASPVRGVHATAPSSSSSSSSASSASSSPRSPSPSQPRGRAAHAPAAQSRPGLAQAAGEGAGGQGAALAPSFSLLEQPENVRLLTELLFARKPSQVLATHTWSLLTDVPTDAKVFTAIRALTLDWSALVEVRSVYHLLYSLEIMHYIAQRREGEAAGVLVAGERLEPEEAEAWAARMAEEGGLERLLEILAQVQRPDSPLCVHTLGKQCALLTICVLRLFFKRPPDTQAAKLMNLLRRRGRELDRSLLECVRLIALDETGDGEAALREDGPGSDRAALDKDIVVNAMALRKHLAAAEVADDVAGDQVFLVPRHTDAAGQRWFEQWLWDGLLASSKPAVRECIVTALKSVSCKHQGLLVALVALLGRVAAAEGTCSQSKNFFELLQHVITARRDSEPFSTQALLRVLLGCLEKQKPAERLPSARAHQDRFDQTLHGLLRSVCALLAAAPSARRKRDSNGSCASALDVGEGVLASQEGANGCAEQVGEEEDCSREEQIKVEMLEFVFDAVLFGLSVPDEASGERQLPLAKSNECRHAALQLLLQLARSSTSCMLQLLQLVQDQHKQMELAPHLLASQVDLARLGSELLYRGGPSQVRLRDRERMWHYAPSVQSKAESGFVGLRNLGCICYMNSLLQQLFMIPELRHAIFTVADSKKRKPEDAAPGDAARTTKSVTAATAEAEAAKRLQHRELLFQVRKMFVYLQESERRFYDMAEFCERSVALNHGRPIDIFEQQDVDEFFNVLMDQLESALERTSEPHVLRNLFGGVLCNQILCKEGCKHRSEREEKFMVCQLEVKGKASVQESLDLYVEGEMLEGDNKYLCGECDEKRDAQKRACFAKLPDVLMIHLKRFEFDLEQLRKIKVNDLCEFPTELDMRKYTREGLDEDAGTAPAEKDDSYEYELAGILVHTGTADSGHYYSYIKERFPAAGRSESSWFAFNDEQVTPFDETSIPHNSFGGVDCSLRWDRSQAKQVHQWAAKPFSAYLLIYERRAFRRKRTVGAAALVRALPAQLRTQCWEENVEFLKDEHVFDAQYSDFVSKLASAALRRCRRGALQVAPAALRAVGCYCLNTLVHAKDKASLETLLQVLRGLVEIAPAQGRAELLGLFEANGGTAIKQVLLRCPVLHVREEMARLLSSLLCEGEGDRRAAFARHDSRVLEALLTEAHYELGDLGVPDSGALLGVSPQPFSQSDLLAPPEVLGERLWVECLDVPCVPPVQSPAARTVGWMLGFVTEAGAHWKTLAQFFQVLCEWAQNGEIERRLMIRLGALPRLLDFLLGQQSPAVRVAHGVEDRCLDERPPLGDKYAQPHLAGAVRLLRELVCSCRVPGAAANAPSTAGAGGDALGWLELQLLLQPALLPVVFDSDASVADVVAVFCHVCRGRAAYSDLVLDALLHHLGTLGTMPAGPAFKLAQALLSLDDGFADRRIRRFLSGLFELLSRGAGGNKLGGTGTVDAGQPASLAPECVDASVCLLQLRGMLLLDALHEPIGDWLLSHGAAFWVQFMVLHDDAATRRGAAALVLQACQRTEEREAAILANGAEVAEVKQARAASVRQLREEMIAALLDFAAGDTMRALCSVEQYEALEDLPGGKLPKTPLSASSLRYLSGGSSDGLDGKALGGDEADGGAAARELRELEEQMPVEPRCYQLVSLARLLKLALQRWPALAGSLVQEAHFEGIIEAVLTIDEHKLECDWNKGELIALLQQILALEPRFVRRLAAHPKLGPMLNISMTVRPMEEHFAYNELYAPPYYEVFAQLICEPSARHDMLERLSELQHLRWAVRYYFLDVNEYECTARPLYFILRAVMSRSVSLRQHVLNVMLQLPELVPHYRSQGLVNRLNILRHALEVGLTERLTEDDDRFEVVQELRADGALEAGQAFRLVTVPFVLGHGIKYTSTLVKQIIASNSAELLLPRAGGGPPGHHARRVSRLRAAVAVYRDLVDLLLRHWRRQHGAPPNEDSAAATLALPEGAARPRPAETPVEQGLDVAAVLATWDNQGTVLNELVKLSITAMTLGESELCEAAHASIQTTVALASKSAHRPLTRSTLYTKSLPEYLAFHQARSGPLLAPDAPLDRLLARPPNPLTPSYVDSVCAVTDLLLDGGDESRGPVEKLLGLLLIETAHGAPLHERVARTALHAGLRAPGLALRAYRKIVQRLPDSAREALREPGSSSRKLLDRVGQSEAS